MINTHHITCSHDYYHSVTVATNKQQFLPFLLSVDYHQSVHYAIVAVESRSIVVAYSPLFHVRVISLSTPIDYLL